MSAEKIDCNVGYHIACVFVGCERLKISPGGIVMMEFCGEGFVGHAAEEDVVGLCKGPFEGVSVLVPFAGEKGLVSFCSQEFGQGGVMCGDVLAEPAGGFVETEKVATCEEHCSAGHTDGTAVAAHNMSVSEGSTGADELIYVWRFDGFYSKGTDCAESLVIGEKQEDIRQAAFSFRLDRADTSGESQGGSGCGE